MGRVELIKKKKIGGKFREAQITRQSSIGLLNGTRSSIARLESRRLQVLGGGDQARVG